MRALPLAPRAAVGCSAPKTACAFSSKFASLTLKRASSISEKCAKNSDQFSKNCLLVIFPASAESAGWLEVFTAAAICFVGASQLCAPIHLTCGLVAAGRDGK